MLFMRRRWYVFVLPAAVVVGGLVGCTEAATAPAAAQTDPRDAIPHYVSSGEDTGGAETVEVLLRHASDAEAIWDQLREDAMMPRNGERGFVVTFWCSTLNGFKGDYVAVGTAARGELGAEQTGLAAGTWTYVEEPDVVC